MRGLRTVVSALALSIPGTAAAWTADEPWRTVETEHFRIHYPLDTEAWALDLAARIDPMRERVALIVGWSPEDLTDIVVLDPWSQSNGFALPFARGARIGVFPTAPPASSGIGNYRLWAEDLLVHEDAHVLHLTRPSRNPVERIVFEGVLGVPAIAVKSPAWVVEGYATKVEGELTGQGRPNSDGRATFLRMLAREGQLPTYGELDGSARWRGRSMRYLVGSAYLEWLSQNHGEERLPELWARMTAREMRSFDEAFVGTFGGPAAELYGRFVAELTAEALAVEPNPGDTALWMDLRGEAEPPAISPDGTQIAVVQRVEKGPSALVVYETAVDEDAVNERAESLIEMLEKDASDVAPVAPKTAPHKEVARRLHPPHRPRSPRFIDDHTLLYTAFVTDPRGVIQPDLFTWDFDSGRAHRVTRNANLREAVPCGGQAVAVHRQHGLSSLVLVDLDTGSTTPLTHPSPTIVDADPRIDDACTTLTWLRHDGYWQPMAAPLKALQDGQPAAELNLPDGGQLLSIDISPDGNMLVAAIGTAGFIDLWQRPTEGTHSWQRRTHMPGGAFDPEVAPGDGGIYFLSTDPRGFDLHHLPADTAPISIEAHPPDEWATQGAIRPPPVLEPPPLPSGESPTPEPYRLGPQKFRLLVGARSASVGTTAWRGAEVGVHIGDLVGRSELLLQVGHHGMVPQDDAPSDPTIVAVDSLGARAAWTWRRLPVHLTTEGWWLPMDSGFTGSGVSADLHRRWSGGGLEGSAGGLAEVDKQGAFDAAAAAELSLWDRRYLGELGLGWAVFGGARLGDTLRADATVQLRTGWRQTALLGSFQHATASGEALDIRPIQPGIQPDLRSTGMVWWRSLPPDILLTEARRARGDVRFMGDMLGLYGESVLSSDDGAWTFLGFDVDAGMNAQPIAAVPAIRGTAGLACQVGDPSSFDVKACGSKDAWSAWLSVKVEPGRPPAYPTGP